MPAPDVALAAKVLAVDQALTHAGLAHAFGGALALAYYAEPRATVDIDVNVFVPSVAGGKALAALAKLGVETKGAEAQIDRDGQCRTAWGTTPVDLFFADLPFHDAIARAARRVPFLNGEIPILAAEHLMVCKALFNRPKDWLDIEQMLIAGADLRIDEVRHWMLELVVDDDLRTQRLQAMIADLLGR